MNNERAGKTKDEPRSERPSAYVDPARLSQDQKFMRWQDDGYDRERDRILMNGNTGRRR